MEKKIELIGVKEVAGMIGINVGTLYQWNHYRKIPHYKFGANVVKFDRQEIKDWIQEHKIEPKKEA